MDALSTFRIVLVALALGIGSYTFASSVAELSSLDRPPFPGITSPSPREVPGWLQMVSPFRSDLESNHALTFALQAIQSAKDKPTGGKSPEYANARARLKQSLSVAPYNAELWLALALVQSQLNPRDPELIEALKMAYFTAPNDARLMPLRLDIATLFDAVADPDVNQLARGDVRLMVTRKPELKAAVVSAYRRASGIGKAFLEQAVQLIEPSFLSTLRG
jgi:hypothetical protein